MLQWITWNDKSFYYLMTNDPSQWHIVKQTPESQSNPYLPTWSGYKAAAIREDIPPKDAPTTAWTLRVQ